MEMFLTLMALSFLGVVVSALAFAAATRTDREPRVETRVDPRLGMAPSHFFVDDRPRTAPPPVPIEALLLQIEGHVRLEQAAAEAFQNAPTVEALHMSTTSPLVH